MAYTEVTLEEASEVIKKAGYKNLVTIEKLDGGWANSNYKLVLKNNTKLVLKIWNEQDEDQVNYLLKITSYHFYKQFPPNSFVHNFQNLCKVYNLSSNVHIVFFLKCFLCFY